MPFDVDSASSPVIREITAAEVEFYREHGWVKLERLLSPDFARDLLKIGQRVREAALPDAGSSDAQEASSKSATRNASRWNYRRTVAENGSEYSYIDDVTEHPLPQLNASKRLAKGAHKLIDRVSLTDRAIGVRCGGGGFLLKTGPGGPATPYHQDYQAGRLESFGSLMFWIALDDLTPDQGTMRFVDGSHRLGPLGAAEPEDGDLLERFPKLVDKFGLSPPMYLAAGDATAHSSLTIHGAPENSTGRTRWSYYQVYASEDCREFSGQRESGDTRATDPSLSFDERLPVVYRPI